MFTCWFVHMSIGSGFVVVISDYSFIAIASISFSGYILCVSIMIMMQCFQNRQTTHNILKSLASSSSQTKLLSSVLSSEQVCLIFSDQLWTYKGCLTPSFLSDLIGLYIIYRLALPSINKYFTQKIFKLFDAYLG